MNTQHELTANLLSFVLGGKSTFTVENTATGGRFTFKVVQSHNGEVHFVKVLTGPNNSKDFSYLGTIFGAKKFVHTVKSPIGVDAPSNKAFSWLFERLIGGKALPETVKFYHACKCGRCGKKLTTPTAVTLGFGADCAETLGLM